MRTEVNGEHREVDATTTLGAVVDTTVSDRRGVAVAIDGEVVPRDARDDTALTDGARIEIVGAVQGGWSTTVSPYGPSRTTIRCSPCASARSDVPR